MVELTKDQCEILVDQIETNIFDLFNIVRNDPDIDNMDWLIKTTDIYKAAKETMKKERAK